MKRLLAALLLSSVVAPCIASGFPGKGSASDWSDALPYYNLANKYLNQKRYGDAAEKYREAISRYQFDPDFYLNLGVAYQKLEDFPDAEQAFRQAISLNDKDYTGFMNLGNAQLRQNRLKEALVSFGKALKLNPSGADKDFLLSDISDIHKVLRNTGQEPMPEPPGQKKSSSAHGKSAGKSSRTATAGNSKASVPTKQNIKQPAAPTTKDWGYS